MTEKTCTVPWEKHGLTGHRRQTHREMSLPLGLVTPLNRLTDMMMVFMKVVVIKVVVACQ